MRCGSETLPGTSGPRLSYTDWDKNMGSPLRGKGHRLECHPTVPGAQDGCPLLKALLADSWGAAPSQCLMHLKSNMFTFVNATRRFREWLKVDIKYSLALCSWLHTMSSCIFPLMPLTCLWEAYALNSSTSHHCTLEGARGCQAEGRRPLGILTHLWKRNCCVSYETIFIRLKLRYRRICGNIYTWLPHLKTDINWWRPMCYPKYATFWV